MSRSRFCPVMLFTLAVLVAVSTSAPARADGPSDEKIKGMLGGMHDAFEQLGEKMGLSADQKTKVAELEKTVAAKVTANPAELDKPTFKAEVLTQFRGILTADQQAKFDEMMGASAQRAGSIRTASSLRQIGMGVMLYANENKGNLPPDLGSLLKQDVTPETFIATGSKTAAPDEATKADPKKLADWVNKNTDFVYLAAGKSMKDAGMDFVVAYVKPEAAGATNSFLMGDGRVESASGEKAAKIIEELKAGKNPPPSLSGK